MDVVQKSVREAQKLFDSVSRDNVKNDVSTYSKNDDHVEGMDHTANARELPLLKHALTALLNVQRSLLAAEETSKNKFEVVLDMPAQATVCRLLEVIVLCGIQPCLSPGIGVPLQQRARMQISPAVLDRIREQIQNAETVLLGEVVDLLLEVRMVQGKGVEPLMCDHILPDVVYGLLELSYSPASKNKYQQPSSTWESKLRKLLNELPTSSALRIVTSLLSASAPTWIKAPLLDYLSAIPLRPHGVRSVIDFVAAATSRVSATEEQKGPSLTPDTLAQISKLLGAVPRSMTEEAYFSVLASQLHELLDGSSGSDFSKIAAAIIGSGILGRKSIGGPGAVGWRIFAEPLIRALAPSSPPTTTGRSAMQGKFRTALSSEDKLAVALNRINLIVHSTPNAGLTKRLLRDIFLPLWGLHNYAFQRDPNSSWTTISWTLLVTYTTRCSNQAQLADLAADLTYDGPASWRYGPGDAGGVEIRLRDIEGLTDPPNLIEIMNTVETRVSKFVTLVSDGSVDDETLGQIFLQISKRWLLPQDGRSPHSLVELEEALDPIGSLVTASLVRAMLEKFEKVLVKNMSNILQLIRQVLMDYNETLEGEARKRRHLEQSSYQGLKSIASRREPSKPNAKTSKQKPGHQPQENSEEMSSMALSLLSATLAAPEPTSDRDGLEALASLDSELASILRHGELLSKDFATSARALQSLISLKLSKSHPAAGKMSPPSAVSEEMATLERDRKTHQDALANLTHDHPAIRAEGLFMLKSLIDPRSPTSTSTSTQAPTSPTIDTTATTYLLVSILQDPEEYVYLASISTLAALASRDPAAVLDILTSCYADAPETRSLDERLRVGEALAKTLNALDEEKPGKPPTHLGHNLRHGVAQQLVAIAGRRGKRLVEAARKRQEQARRDREARRMWGGEVPDISELGGQGEEEDGERGSREANARILRGWEGSDAEEDVRIRTSALTLLGRILRSEAGVGDAETALELGMQILALELGEEKALLRRAAAVLALDLLRSRQVPLRRVDELVEVLRYVKEEDGDDMVRGHVGVLLEEVEELRVIKFTEERQALMQPRFNLPEGRLAGLTVDPDSGLRFAGHRMIEEVED